MDFLESLQNPTLIRFIGNGPTRSYYGRVTNKRYRFGGSVVENFVDERDLIGFTTRNFEVVELKKATVIAEHNDGKTTEITAEVPVEHNEPIEITIEDGDTGEETEVVIEFDDNDLYESIHEIKSLSEFNKTSLLENDIHTAKQLYAMGKEWFKELPRISDSKADKVFEELEELLGE